MKLVFDLDGAPVPVEIVQTGPGRFSVILDGGGRPREVTVPHLDPDFVAMRIDGVPYRAQLASTRDSHHVAVGGEFYDLPIVRDEPRSRRPGSGAAGGRVVSPMPGKVTKLLVAEGDEVAASQPLLIVEAMKMENEIRAPVAGKVKRMHVRTGQPVTPSDTLVELEPAAE